MCSLGRNRHGLSGSFAGLRGWKICRRKNRNRISANGPASGAPCAGRWSAARQACQCSGSDWKSSAWLMELSCPGNWTGGSRRPMGYAPKCPCDDKKGHASKGFRIGRVTDSLKPCCASFFCEWIFDR